MSEDKINELEEAANAANVEDPTEPQQPAGEQDSDGQGGTEQEDDIVFLEPEQVTITYPGFKEPKTEEQIHYELATLDVLIQTLKQRKAKLNRNWTHHKLNVFLNESRIRNQQAEEASNE